jgi:PAS domain S-box-containing protein
MLSQKTYNNVISFKINELHTNLNIMENSHKYLISLPMSDSIKEIYFGKTQLDEKVKEYILHGKGVRKNIEDINSKYIEINSNILLQEFDNITSLYQLESENKIQQIQDFEIFILIITLFVLLLIGLYILKPASEQFIKREKEIIDEKDYSNIIIESNTNAIIAIGVDLKVKTFNKAAEKIFGYSKEEMIGKRSLLNIVPLSSVKAHNIGILNYFKTGVLKHRGANLELTAKRKNKETFPIRISFGKNENIGTKEKIVIANIQDITEEKEKEAKIKESIILLEQYKTAIDLTSIVSKTDINGKITYVNEQFCKKSKYSKEELIGQAHNIIRHENMSQSTFKDMWNTIKNKGTWTGQIENKAKDGSSYHLKSMVMPILDSEGKILEYISIRTDISALIEIKQDIMNTQKEVLFTLGELGEMRSKETGQHVSRVALYSALIATEYGLGKEEVGLIKMASPMHDIGKVAIPDEILLKPGKLNQEEMEIMKSHSQIGYDVFYKSKHKMLQTAAIISHEHHEKYDGSGYPQGLKADEISIYGRITAIADVFDALSHDRVYKKAWSIEETLKFMIEEKSKSFDPILVDILIANIDKILSIKNEYNL